MRSSKDYDSISLIDRMSSLDDLIPVLGPVRLLAVVVGVILHLGYFNRGEHYMYGV